MEGYVSLLSALPTKFANESRSHNVKRSALLIQWCSFRSPNICDCYWNKGFRASSKSTIMVRNWRQWWIAKRLVWTVDLLMSRSCACGQQEWPACCEKQSVFFSNGNSNGMFHACCTILFTLKYAIKLIENGYINPIPSANVCGWHWIVYRWIIKKKNETGVTG